MPVIAVTLFIVPTCFTPWIIINSILAKHGEYLGLPYLIAPMAGLAALAAVQMRAFLWLIGAIWSVIIWCVCTRWFLGYWRFY